MRARISVLALLLCTAFALPACGGAESDEPAVGATDDALTSWSTSYAALADARTPKAFDTVATGVGAFSATTLPHEAKTFRKQIGELRDYVDLFAFAYDKKGPGDPWVDLRADLDEGYETVGAFKDLFDAQGLPEGIAPDQIHYADVRELDKRRAKVLAWKTKLTPRIAAHRAYVAHADAKKMHAHDAKDQSQFFWAGADVEPALGDSGLESLAALSRGLLDHAAKDFAAIADLEEVTTFDDHETFHDLRKRVRAIVKVVDYFPELLEPGAAAPLAIARELVDRYGSLNDRISAYDLAKKSERKKLGDAIEAEWKELEKWQKKADAGAQLKELKKRVRKHG